MKASKQKQPQFRNTNTICKLLASALLHLVVCGVIPFTEAWEKQTQRTPSRSLLALAEAPAISSTQLPPTAYF